MSIDIKQILAERGLDEAKCVDCDYYGEGKIPFKNEYGNPYMEDGCLLRAKKLLDEGRSPVEIGVGSMIPKQLAMYGIDCDDFIHRAVAEAYRQVEKKERQYNDLLARKSRKLSSYELYAVAKGFRALDYKDSSTLAKECQKEANEKRVTEKKTKRIIVSITIIAIVALAVGLYFFLAM